MIKGTALGALILLLLTGCQSLGDVVPVNPRSDAPAEEIPTRITIVPDDYHTPYAGVLADGRQFFVTDELFEVTGPGEIIGYLATFLWTADGEFESVDVEEASRPDGYPPGQPVPSDDTDALARRLAALGDYELTAISVAPFREEVGGVVFGFVPGRYDDGTVFVELDPGSVIAMYAPWDGLEYDT